MMINGLTLFVVNPVDGSQSEPSAVLARYAFAVAAERCRRNPAFAFPVRVNGQIVDCASTGPDSQRGAPLNW